MDIRDILLMFLPVTALANIQHIFDVSILIVCLSFSPARKRLLRLVSSPVKQGLIIEGSCPIHRGLFLPCYPGTIQLLKLFSTFWALGGIDINNCQTIRTSLGVAFE